MEKNKSHVNIDYTQNYSFFDNLQMFSPLNYFINKETLLSLITYTIISTSLHNILLIPMTNPIQMSITFNFPTSIDALPTSSRDSNVSLR